MHFDDFTVMDRTFDERLKNLQRTLVTTAGLKLSVKKCALFQKQVKYLGQLVIADGIFTDEDKIQAVKDWPLPQNLHEQRSFLGLCTYCRRFMSNIASVAASLHELTKKSKVYQWGESQEKAFLCAAPVLAYRIHLMQ